MSPLATLSIAWTAVCAYLCAYYCTLYARRRADGEYLAFGLLSGAMGVYALGAAMHADATSLAQAATAQELQFVGMLVASAFYVEFAHHLAMRPGRSELRIVYALAIVGALCDVAGLVIDPSVAAEPDLINLLHTPAQYTPQLTAAGVALVGACVGSIGYGTWLLAVRAGGDGDVRIVLCGAALMLTACVWDAVVRVTPVGGPTLLEHSYMLFAATVSYVLLSRVVRTANALSSTTVELRRTYHELHDAQEQLLRKEQLATMGELSAVIAHEVRNPLAIIKNAVSGLHRPTLRDADRQVLLKILDEEADRLNRLVGDLLAYARPVVPQRQTVNVEELVLGAVELARAAQQRDEQVSFDLALEQGSHLIQGDPDLLRQAIVNVAENAIQAMPEGGTLTVRTYATTLNDQACVAISIRDTGEGMDTLVRSKATDPFFTTRPTGTGLGLAIVHRLIHSHGGKVQIESSHGTGTNVIMILPVQRTGTGQAVPLLSSRNSRKPRP